VQGETFTTACIQVRQVSQPNRRVPTEAHTVVCSRRSSTTPAGSTAVLQAAAMAAAAASDARSKLVHELLMCQATLMACSRASSATE
jgi:hypothetical protein